MNLLWQFWTPGPIRMDPERNFAPDWRRQTSNWSIQVHIGPYLVSRIGPRIRHRHPGTVHGWPSGQVPGLCQVRLLVLGVKPFLCLRYTLFPNPVACSGRKTFFISQKYTFLRSCCLFTCIKLFNFPKNKKMSLRNLTL